jgi:hypothetical protein
MQPQGGVGCEGTACPKGWTLPPRGKDNSHLCNRAGGSAPGSTCSRERSRHWIRCVCATGTTTNIFCDFCDHVCRDIDTNNIPGTDFHRILIWDNLAAHHSRYVHNTVVNRVGPSNFSIVPQPPYHPKYGLIEYKICEVMEKIRLKKEEDWNMNRLEHEILLAANQIERFEETFIHCGY